MLHFVFQIKHEREEEERKKRIQLYVFILRCVAYTFNAKQSSDMQKRHLKVSKDFHEKMRNKVDVSKVVSVIKKRGVPFFSFPASYNLKSHQTMLYFFFLLLECRLFSAARRRFQRTRLSRPPLLTTAKSSLRARGSPRSSAEARSARTTAEKCSGTHALPHTYFRSRDDKRNKHTLCGLLLPLLLQRDTNLVKLKGYIFFQRLLSLN